ncbi:MAG: prolipoprotein diacylglyceryl transferase family protein [Novosphingobium sp.]
MIHLPTVWWAHYVGDVAAWSGAALAAHWQYRRWPEAAEALARLTTPSYHVTLALGALAGAWILGSANSLHSIAAAPSHSIAGALAGGIAGVELWKWRHGVQQSTGAAFVLPLSVGISLGRLGCLFSGRPDFTYGTPSALPWAVDLGDGVARHPVQLYESLAMALFAAAFIVARKRGDKWTHVHAFHALILFYAAQRFVWEFFKPYPTLVGPLNLFHILMLGFGAYGIVWWRRGSDKPTTD